MKNTFGTSVTLTLFGESHGESVGAVLDGMAPGIPVDTDFIAHRLSLRRPQGEISTPRAEKDDFRIESGVFNGKTTGTPICIIIPNREQRSCDYDELKDTARPGHADYTAYCKYHGFSDYRGGGHFSGRVTAGITAAGAIAISALNSMKIEIGTHLARCAGIDDRKFSDYKSDIAYLSEKAFPVLDSNAEKQMTSAIIAAKNSGDSVGGILETAVTGLSAGIGEPWFGSVESVLSATLFAIPAVKGVEFGDGFSMADMTGSFANDPFRVQNGNIITEKNSNGGINGGITNGMPMVFRVAVKPTPTISSEQKTVDFVKGKNTSISSHGRHDPCIAHRARAVVDSITALSLCDIIALRFGTDSLNSSL